MAFECGFFNSIDGDRTYNAEQMNNPYKRIVSNGVFAKPSGETSDDFQVMSTGGMEISVRQGDGIFADKWARNTADFPMTVPTASVTSARIDSVIVRINLTERMGSIEYIQGVPDENPVPPTLTRSTTITEYRLADIYVRANVTAITQSNITDTRASTDCGFITNLLWQSDLTATYAQWQSQFNEWFNNLRLTMSTITAVTSFTSRYIVTAEKETVIPIQIDRFNSELDILDVYINGMRVLPELDYTIENFETITLTLPLIKGAAVDFICLKSVDGTEAEKIVDQVTELYTLAPTASTGSYKVTAQSGESVLQKFRNSQAGFFTMNAVSGALELPATGTFNFFGHLADRNNGYLFAMQSTGEMYQTVLVGGVFTSWKKFNFE